MQVVNKEKSLIPTVTVLTWTSYFLEWKRMKLLTHVQVARIVSIYSEWILTFIFSSLLTCNLDNCSVFCESVVKINTKIRRMTIVSNLR